MRQVIPKHLSLAQVDIWFQDEARFGQRNTTTRLWAKKGTRPRAIQQKQYEYAYLYGAVCPANGKTEALISPVANKEAMIYHLQQISKATSPGRQAVVIMDGASWHQENLTDDIDNVTIIKLPPYSPELNPIEQVWSWLRQHCLANRCFANYEDIVDSCSKAWNEFTSDINRVISMCTRSWSNQIIN